MDVAATYAAADVAAGFDACRDRSMFEAAWLERATGHLDAGAAVLDLGCGTGEPVARWLAGRGHRVTGVDASPAMLQIARAGMPGGTWIRADMRRLALGRRFDAVIAWNSLFHLDPAGQRAALARIAGHLAPGGRVLATVGPRRGEAVGHVGARGDRRPVYHASLSIAEYAGLLDHLGLEVVAFVADDPSCRGHSILMAVRPEEVP